jgi:outer membrane lipoprotein-sorting protein
VASGTYTRFLAGSTEAYSLRVEILGLDQLRWDLSGSGPLAPATTVRNGDAGWNQTPDGTVNLSLSQTAAIGSQWFPLLALAKWTITPGVTASYIGLETVAGTSVHHITLTRAFAGTATRDFQRVYEAISRCELYVSPQTNLPVRIRYYAHPNGSSAGIPMDLVFSNYTQVAGFWFPLRVSEYYGDAQTREVDFQTLSVNAPVSPSDFSQG